MGPGSESTLRIDEPLHLMFLVFYLITYFCCAYILFVCFKQCRRLVSRKPPRPVSLSRLRSVAEALNNLPRRSAASSRVVSSRQLQVSLCNLGGTHAVLCPPPYEERELSQMSGTSDTADTISSNLSPLHMTTFTFRRIYYHGRGRGGRGERHARGPLACFIMDDGETGSGDDDDDEEDDDLPQYEAVAISNVLPPSYSTCVLSTHQAATAGGAGVAAGSSNPCTATSCTNTNTTSNSNSNSDQDPHSHTHTSYNEATATATATNDKVVLVNGFPVPDTDTEVGADARLDMDGNVHPNPSVAVTETKPV